MYNHIDIGLVHNWGKDNSLRIVNNPSNDRPILVITLSADGLASRSYNPDSKVHVANMGPTWVLSAPGGPHAGPMNLATREATGGTITDTMLVMPSSKFLMLSMILHKKSHKKMSFIKLVEEISRKFAKISNETKAKKHHDSVLCTVI